LEFILDYCYLQFLKIMITRYFMPYIFYQKTGDEYDTPIEHNGLYEE